MKLKLKVACLGVDAEYPDWSDDLRDAFGKFCVQITHEKPVDCVFPEFEVSFFKETTLSQNKLFPTGIVAEQHIQRLQSLGLARYCDILIRLNMGYAQTEVQDNHLSTLVELKKPTLIWTPESIQDAVSEEMMEQVPNLYVVHGSISLLARILLHTLLFRLT